MPDQKQTVIDPWDLLQRLADALAYSASTGSCSVADVKLADEARRAVANRPVPSGADALREAVERLPMFVAACQPVDGWREGQEGPVLHGDCVRRCDVLAEIDRAAPAVASSGAEGEREEPIGWIVTVNGEPHDCFYGSERQAERAAFDLGFAPAGVERIARKVPVFAASAPAVTDPEGEDDVLVQAGAAWAKARAVEVGYDDQEAGEACEDFGGALRSMLADFRTEIADAADPEVGDYGVVNPGSGPAPSKDEHR